MTWEAANAPVARRARKLQDGDSRENGEAIPAQRKRRATETVEAALSRLSKAYTTSIECLGSLNQMKQLLEKETTITEEALGVIKRVSNAARNTLEIAILLDPLVLAHASTLKRVMEEFSDSGNDRWKIVREKRQAPPQLSSTAHKSTVREFAYLALVNYADLLTIYCPCGWSNRTANASILDKGVTRKPKFLEDRCRCCWDQELEEDTQRLVLTALCDASTLDGSDPTLWLKLACAARGLERIREQANPGLGDGRQYRHLQRYALERGSKALPPNMPPNRTIMRALHELDRAETLQSYPCNSDDTPEKLEIILNIPRYSWSMLGRMIVRACREGCDYRPDSTLQTTGSKGTRSMQFGSPSISLQLSPMLVLPSKVLGKICQCLENASIWKFEATCRALSVSIISARASMEQEKTVIVAQRQYSRQETIETLAKPEPRNEKSSKMLPISDPKPSEPTEEKPEDGVSKKLGSDKARSGEEKNEEPPQIHRSSKRLLSQLITSGKIADRTAKRQSVEFCFLAATLSYTKEAHKKVLNRIDEGEKTHEQNTQGLTLSSPYSNFRGSSRIPPSDSLDRHRNEARERLGDSSLSAFVERWSSRNSGPIDLLMRYLGHIAINIEDVFSSDPGGSVVLTSCLLGCFEQSIRRTGCHQGLAPHWFKPVGATGCIERSLELFAIDLLHTELLLRQCDRHSPSNVVFDDDCNLVSLMVPDLLHALGQLKQHFAADMHGSVRLDLLVKWEVLKVRCTWLAAAFYLWRSRLSRIVSESRQAEEEGIEFISETANCFNSRILRSVGNVRTPHLVSPGRPEGHWKDISYESLVKFRDEIQASSVVSLARQKFQELVTEIDQKSEASETGRVSEDDAKALAKIGETLFERYQACYGDSEAKHAELVDDFLTVHGEELLTLSSQSLSDIDSTAAWQKLRSVVPSGAIVLRDLLAMSNPCILSILITCLNLNSQNWLSVVELIARLGLTAHDQQNLLLQRTVNAQELKRRQSEGGQSDDNFSDSDDDSLVSDDTSGDRITVNKNVDERRARQCCYLVQFLIERLHESFSNHDSGADKAKFVVSVDCKRLIESSLRLSSDWFLKSSRKMSSPDVGVDLKIFRSIRAFVRCLCASDPVSDIESIQHVYFGGMVGIILSQRQALESLLRAQGERAGRSARQRLCRRRAEFTGAVASELGYILSQHLGSVHSARLMRSSLLPGATVKDSGISSDARFGLTAKKFTLFCDSLLWLWKYASQPDSDSTTPSTSSGKACSAFDRPIVKELRVPIAAAIVGLCGSATCTRDSLPSKERETSERSEGDDRLCLSEFFDSDASANDWLSEEDSSEVTQRKLSCRELLRAICHAVHCVELVVRTADDKSAISTFVDKEYVYDKVGPVLPIVIVRVLNFFADILLSEFGNLDTDSDIWSKEYPFSTRTTGHLLDSILHRAYRWLHGFTLVGEKAHHVAGKDLGTSVTASTELTTKVFVPENTSAAAQLYRCIVRAYAAGRRSPPKAALEIVSSALPPMQETLRSKALRSFMFTTEKNYFGSNEVMSLVRKSANWDEPFIPIQYELGERDPDDCNALQPEKSSILDDEVMTVRKGICRELARGPLPVALSDAGKSKSEIGVDDERASATRMEEELSKKFSVIVDDLCLGDVRSSDGWYRAGQCLTMKADLVADRLGFTKGFARNTNFSVPKHRPRFESTLDITELESEQKREYESMINRWVQCLGEDLSLFVRFTWSSFSSLCALSDQIGEKGYSDAESGTLRIHVWKEIHSLYKKGDFVGWQQAWGGLFVSALRTLAVRFMCVALYLVHKTRESAAVESAAISEICESLGIMLYSELMASQSYGYPMHEMTQHRKRELANVAQVCFQSAVDTVENPLENDESEDRATWDLLFMIGKCREKTAGTYYRESFTEKVALDHSKVRMYERNMSQALENYSKALSQAKEIEDGGGFIVEQAGGSAHGVTEVFYRLHASRLKCLISAVSRCVEDIDRAELEALRLTEQHWFQKPSEDTKFEDLHVRDRVWNVVADIVAALAQCRLDHQFFHRSVYRHAQALMWAPVLCDPVTGRSDGSLGKVAATRSYRLRGLNNSTHAANSAEVIMSCLFDKKRAQLCAVWVTTTAASSPFQILNTSIRKYDSLRGKYISAYIESLRLCRRRSELETFLKWTSSSKRDLPSYFQASAIAKGGLPEKAHTECLLDRGRSITAATFLRSAKRQANSAFADVLLRELSDDDKSSDKKKAADNQLKCAYACFLRLHCSAGDLKKSQEWKYGQGTIREVDALCQSYLALGDPKKVHKDLLDWSGGYQKSAVLDAALEKCRSLFPSLSGGFFSKKASSKPKKGDDDESPSGDAPGFRKRKPASAGGNSEKVSFEVPVPSEAVTGNTFLAEVVVGHQTKKVKLTVPAGNPSTLRFTLKIPKSKTSE